MSAGTAGHALHTEGDEPVAVIGIGCRFPGDVGSPEDFWKLLTSGRETSGEVPEERWELYKEFGPEYEAALRRAVRSGNFIDGIDRFDARFFGISPREAALMDPQQRVLLEVSWEALENAGIPPHELAGTDAGVFVGVCTGDYGGRILEDLPGIEAWTGIGAATCALANRVSHVLDLRGPSLSVDTACSASLVALHLACQSLRLGESTVAFAGGVNLLVSPGQTLTLDSAGALSPDGRSKSFDATADGYGRGEGCGVVVLKRLSDARRDGDRVLALVRGSAVNQDGRTNGIMAPCGTAQEHVMVRACESAGIEPGTVGYVEAHGTGTQLGDPLEAAALAAVYGAGRPEGDPCLVGSVKSNIGHLEGAAGISGVIKAVLALDRAELPPTLLATKANPDIAWDESGLRLVTEQTPWVAESGPLRAGVSGFGYGGTVAHIVLEQAPGGGADADTEDAAGATADDGDENEHEEGNGNGAAYRLFPLSAVSEAALRRQAADLAEWITERSGEVPLASVGHTLALRRTALDRRAVVAASDGHELADRLLALAAGRPENGVVSGARAVDGGAGLVWVFSGHGSQWSGMGRELLAKPPFARVVDTLEPVFAKEIGFSPRQALIDDDFDQVDRIQCMIFTMQVGLAALWRSYGVAPDAVIGHSVGEIAAAVTSGALTLEDGGRLICRRSLLLRRVAGEGAMAMVTLPFAEVEERLSGRTDLVAAIAASPVSTVVSGDPDAVAALENEWPSQGIGVRRIASDVAFHSPHMDPLLDELTSAASDLVPRERTVPMYSTALPDPRGEPAAGTGYWAANLRNPVRLEAAVTAAVEDGYRDFLEVSPHPVVAHSINETLAEAEADDAFVGVTLRRNRPEELTLLTGAAALHCRGIAVDWRRLQPSGELLALPTYPWQGGRHWHRSSPASHGQGRGHRVESHTLLGALGTIAGSALRVWRTTLEDGNRPYPGSHTLNDVEIVPAAVLVETFRQAAVEDGELPALADVVMQHPLMTAGRSEIQVVHDTGELWLASRTPADDPGEEPPWLTHTHAVVEEKGAAAPLPAALGDAGAHRLLPADPGLVHQRLAEVGVPATGFDWEIEELLYGVGRLHARVRAPQSAQGPATWAALLDAVMSIAPSAFPGAPLLRMVVHIDDVVTAGAPPESAVIEVALDQGREDTVDALIADADGTVVARLGGLRYPVIEQPTVEAAGADDEAADTEAESLAGLTPQELHEHVLGAVGNQIATEMGLPEEELNPRRPLLEQGLDSVMTVAIRRRLEKRFGQRLPATVFWQQPTVTAITDHLVGLLSPAGQSAE